jgi:hypothetical protein
MRGYGAALGQRLDAAPPGAANSCGSIKAFTPRKLAHATTGISADTQLDPECAAEYRAAQHAVSAMRPLLDEARLAAVWPHCLDRSDDDRGMVRCHQVI